MPRSALPRPLGPLAGAAVLAVLLLAGCGLGGDRARLQRRPVQPRADGGWVRLPLDAEAQRNAEGLWLGDAEGRPLPFLMEQEGLWEPRQLDIEKLLLGGDADGRITAEFSLRIPEAWKIRDREQLRIDLDVEGRGAWACRVDVQRRLEGGPFLGLPRESPLEVHELGAEGSNTRLVVPWDAQAYRIALTPILGKAPNLRSLKVWAVTDPREFEPDAVQAPVELQREGNTEPERWRIRLSAPERVVGLDLALRSTSPPGRPALIVPGATPGTPTRTMKLSGLVWNLPGAAGRSSHLGMDSQVEDRFLLTLPSGAQLDQVKLLVRRQALIFPSEAQRPCFLHLGGTAPKLPAMQATLPPSRLVYGRDALRMGPAEPDPQGLPLARSLSLEGRRRLRWGAWAGAALLALVAWRLLGRRG